MYQYSTLDNATEYPATVAPYVNYSFNNLVYSAMANVNFDAQNTLRIHARSRTNNPSVSQLQDVPDFSNSTYVRGGNAALRPAYTNRLHAFLHQFQRGEGTDLHGDARGGVHIRLHRRFDSDL